MPRGNAARLWAARGLVYAAGRPRGTGFRVLQVIAGDALSGPDGGLTWADMLDRGRTAEGHIFNLGHGVLPQTDPGVITRLAALVQERTVEARV